MEIVKRFDPFFLNFFLSFFFFLFCGECFDTLKYCIANNDPFSVLCNRYCSACTDLILVSVCSGCEGKSEGGGGGGFRSQLNADSRAVSQL